MKSYKQIFILNLPSFYKINLLNEINKRQKVLAIFLGYGDYGRNSDFYDTSNDFDMIKFSDWNFFQKINFLLFLILNRRTEIVTGGWDNIWCWIFVFLSHRKYNALICESSCHESVVTGIKGFFKRLFLLKISKCYCSGKAHVRLIHQLTKHCECLLTKGVGVYRRQKQPVWHEKKDSVKKFLYIGRLIDVKNLDFLISVFNEMPDFQLTIVGFGDLEEYLKKMAKDNIIFTGYVKNEDVYKVYQQHDVFILFSKSETWGMVVEEAMNCGLPAIVSDRVGCAEDLIVSDENGYIVKLDDRESLKKTLTMISDLSTYNRLRKNVCNINTFEIEKKQIETYIIK